MPPKGRSNEAQWMEKQSRWQIKVQVNGKRKTFYSSTPNKRGKAECERKADAWIADGASDDPRVETAWKAFLEDVQRTTSKGNYRNIESAGRLWILPSIKAKRVSSVTLQDWQDILTKMFEAGKSHKYIHDIRGAMTSFYQYCRRCRLPLERPDALKIHKDAPEGIHEIIQPDKLKLLFSVNWIMRNGKKEPCFFIHAWRFLVLTGMRRGELCGLRREDVSDGILHIRRSFNELGEETQGKTKNAQRYIVLNTHMANVLNEQKRELRARGIVSPWLFPDEGGNRLDGIHLSKKWKTYRKQHDVGATIYGMRHTLVSVSKADVPIELLKGIVGHSAAMDTTGTYGHTVEGEALRASEMLEAIFDRILY